MLEGIWWHCHKSRPEGAVAAPNAEQEDPLDAASLILKSKDGDTVRASFGIVKQSATIGDAEYLNSRKPTGVELLIEPSVDQCLRRDVEPVVAELGLQLWDVQQDGESRLYVSTAREGFKFAARFVTHYCDACVYDGLALRIIKDSA